MTIECADDLLSPSSLPGGIPDFAGVTPQTCLAALREGMKRERERWDVIASCPEPATIDNTLVPLELAGAELERAESVFFTMTSAVGGDEWAKAEEEIVADFVDHAHAFSTHLPLYRRVVEAAENATEEEASFVLADYIRDWKRAGIHLDKDKQEELRSIDRELGAAEQAFTKASVTARGCGPRGLDAEDLGPAAGEGIRADDGSVTLPLANFTTHPALAHIPSQQTRRLLLEASLNRANGTGEVDTRTLVAQIVTLRARRAELLGFDSFADMVVDGSVAPSTEDVWTLLTSLGQSAQRALASEEKVLAELADTPLEAGDWTYYEEKLRARSFSIDSTDLKNYLELSRVIVDGVFYAATCLYGVTFTPREDVAGWVEGVKAWEVRDASGLPLGLFVGDYYTRETKEGGAWMHELVSYNQLTGELPVIANTLNLARPAEGEPTLLTWDEVETCFHEFGHALHGLFAATRYPSHAGTSVPRDFVEFPSQLSEMWAYHPQILRRYLRHWETGLAAGEDVVEEISRSKSFGQAYATLEYVAAAALDLAWHTTPVHDLPDAAGVEQFEAAQLARLGLDHRLVPPRFRSTYFTHTFGGGYASAYWSYIWAELMVADMEDWIRTGPLCGDNEGLNRDVGEALRRGVLSRGYSRAAMDSYREVTGREPDPRSVARRRGLA